MEKKIDPRMTKARAALLQKHPFWGALALYLKLEEDPAIEGFATDGEVLKYNPKTVAEISDKELAFWLAHEISHCAYGHHIRRGNRDAKTWNEAADYAINQDLVKAGFSAPDDCLLDAKYEGLSAEQIYASLKKQQQDQQQGQGQGQPGKGSPVQKGQVMDAAKPGDVQAQAQIEADWKVRVAQAVAAEKGKNAGKLPANMERMFENTKKSIVDWRAVLRRFIDEKNRTDFSWQKPNKRLMSYGFIAPGMVPDGLNHIGVAVDTSGSIDKDALSLFMAELQAAADDGATRKITVVSCDTTIKARADFEEGERIAYNPVGGGGTAFAPAFRWFEENEPDVACIIYFTDLDCPSFGPEPYCPVLWLAHDKPELIASRAAKVPFGEVLPLVD